MTRRSTETAGSITEGLPASKYVAAIHAAAIKEFARNGYHGTSMRDLATHVGVHAGSLYVHIKNKEELLYQLVSANALRADRRMLEILASDLTPPDKLRLITREHVKWIRDNQESATVYFYEWRHLQGEHRIEVTTLRNRWNHSLQEIIQASVDEGYFHSLNTQLAGIAFVGILNSTFGWFRDGSQFDDVEVADQFTNYLFHGWASHDKSPI